MAKKNTTVKKPFLYAKELVFLKDEELIADVRELKEENTALNRLQNRITELEDALLQFRNSDPTMEETALWQKVMEGKP